MIDDGLHYSTNKIDGYNRQKNFIVSPRDDGKTTAVIKKPWKSFKEEKRPSLVFRRQNADITDDYLDSLIGVTEKIEGKSINAFHLKSDGKKCVVDIKIDGKVYLRVIALQAPLGRLKSAFFANVAYIIFDEFIINTRLGEKYLTKESFKFKEIWDTYSRETKNLKAYFMGNPYSFYNPYFADLGIDSSALRKDCVLAGKDWAIERHSLNPELKKQLIARNPLYSSEEDNYAKYALEGEPINDANIPILDKLPQGFSLDVVFSIDGKLLGVYANNSMDGDFSYWIGELDKLGSRRTAYCFDFKDLVDRSVLIGIDERRKLSRIRCAIRSRSVAFETLECDYIIEEIYNNL